MDNFANFSTRYVMLWPWLLTSWSYSFAALERHVFKVCTKFERSRIIHGRVIDDLARFRSVILGVGNFYWEFSGMRESNFTKLGSHIGRLWLYTRCLFQISHIMLHFQSGRLKVEWCLDDAKFRTFWPLWKLGTGEISIPITEGLPTTQPPKYIWWPSTWRLLSAVDW